MVPGDNFKALEVARQLGITVARNIIADPDWDEARFTTIREWALSIIASQLLRGQTNFVKAIWKFNWVHSVKRQLADHARPVTYTMTPPKPALTTKPRPDQLYVHMPVRREAVAPAATEAAGSSWFGAVTGDGPGRRAGRRA